MPKQNTSRMMAVLVFASAVLLTISGTAQTKKSATQKQRGPSRVQGGKPSPEVNVPQGGTAAEPLSIHPLPDENLNRYKARMDAYFAPQLRSRGEEALVKEEAGKYNQYLAFLRYWEPRLFGLRGDFKAYFQLEKNYYRDRRRSGTRPAVRPAVNSQPQAAALLLSSNLNPWHEVGNISKPTSNVGAEGTGPTKFLTFYNPSPSRMLTGSIVGGLFYSNNGG